MAKRKAPKRRNPQARALLVDQRQAYRPRRIPDKRKKPPRHKPRPERGDFIAACRGYGQGLKVMV